MGEAAKHVRRKVLPPFRIEALIPEGDFGAHIDALMEKDVDSSRGARGGRK